MDKGFKTLIGAIAVCIFLIALKLTVFANIGTSDELIPGVTDDPIFAQIASNSTLGEYILSDSFTNEISGMHIESKSNIYATNETDGERLFDRCRNSLIGTGFEEDYIKEYAKEGKYTGIYKNDTKKIVFHIFEGNDVSDHTGYYLVLTVYERRL